MGGRARGRVQARLPARAPRAWEGPAASLGLPQGRCLPPGRRAGSPGSRGQQAVLPLEPTGDPVMPLRLPRPLASLGLQLRLPKPPALRRHTRPRTDRARVLTAGRSRLSSAPLPSPQQARGLPPSRRRRRPEVRRSPAPPPSGPAPGHRPPRAARALPSQSCGVLTRPGRPPPELWGPHTAGLAATSRPAPRVASGRGESCTRRLANGVLRSDAQPAGEGAGQVSAAEKFVTYYMWEATQEKREVSTGLPTSVDCWKLFRTLPGKLLSRNVHGLAKFEKPGMLACWLKLHVQGHGVISKEEGSK
ncbi:uncharacterized protein LOC142861609 [Microcebus murinus]|uniref:uncharacterized protein LOC142861609 n=1 Tax=Microcebus murinus TaxID=30608 RepID=UPI003F6D1281